MQHENVSNMLKSQVDFQIIDSPFTEVACFDYNGHCYEDLRDSPIETKEIKFRVILDHDDYDYIENEEITKKLIEVRS